VIEGPDHGASWDTLPSERVERVLCMYRERIVDLYRDPQIRAVMVIRHEPTPGAGPIHPISRIIGVPIIFDDIRDELAAARHHFAYKQRCLQCDILRQELGDGIRVVLETQHFLAYTPYASRRPFETWLVPVTHRHRFESSSDSELADLARMLQGTFKRLHAIQPGTPLDLVVHTAPNERVRLRDDEWRTLSEDFHWHIEIRPDRPARESAGGFAVNPVPPEVAAKELREAIGT
jgi:UDPglucose--hexose-1-phosphate uridylyltransferase